MPRVTLSFDVDVTARGQEQSVRELMFHWLFANAGPAHEVEDANTGEVIGELQISPEADS